MEGSGGCGGDANWNIDGHHVHGGVLACLLIQELHGQSQP